jgi:hypothetical protein
MSSASFDPVEGVENLRLPQQNLSCENSAGSVNINIFTLWQLVGGQPTRPTAPALVVTRRLMTAIFVRYSVVPGMCPFSIANV